MSAEHVSRVRKLYKLILRLHRSLPGDLRILGDNYAKEEFRRHKKCQPQQARIFLNEWQDYASKMWRQASPVRVQRPVLDGGKPGVRPQTPGNVQAISAVESPQTPGNAKAMAAEERPQTLENAQAMAADEKPQTPGNAMAMAAEERPQTPGNAQAMAAGVRPLAPGNAQAMAAEERPQTPGNAQAMAAGVRPLAPGNAQAMAAEERPQTPGNAQAMAAGVRPLAPGNAQAMAAEARPQTPGIAQAMAAKEGPQTPGIAQAMAAEERPQTPGIAQARAGGEPLLPRFGFQLPSERLSQMSPEQIYSLYTLLLAAHGDIPDDPLDNGVDDGIDLVDADVYAMKIEKAKRFILQMEAEDNFKFMSALMEVSDIAVVANDLEEVKIVAESAKADEAKNDK